MVGMIPAHQRLETNQSAIHTGNFGLILGVKLVIFKPFANIGWCDQKPFCNAGRSKRRRGNRFCGRYAPCTNAGRPAVRAISSIVWPTPGSSSRISKRRCATEITPCSIYLAMMCLPEKQPGAKTILWLSLCPVSSRCQYAHPTAL